MKTIKKIYKIIPKKLHFGSHTKMYSFGGQHK